MIGALTEKIVSFCEKQKLTENQDIELIKYGLFLFLTHIQYLIICLCFGLVFKCVIESIVFFICFSLLRMFCGGFHASTETKCFIISFIAIAVSIILINLFEKRDYNLILIVLAIVSAVITLLLSPIDNKSKPLAINEKKKFRMIVLLIVFIFSVSFVLLFNSFFFISVSIAVSLIVSSLFLLIGKIRKNFPKNEENDNQ